MLIIAVFERFFEKNCEKIWRTQKIVVILHLKTEGYLIIPRF